LPATPLAARCIARFIRLLTSCPPRCSLHHSFLSPADATAAAPLAESLVSFFCRRLARRVARFITRFFLPSTPRPPYRLRNRSFLSLFDALPAVRLAASLVSCSRRRHVRRAACCIARFFLPPTTRLPTSRPRSRSRYHSFLSRAPTCCPRRRSLNRSFLSLADALPAAPLAASLVCFS
jgi:hypothetical protein